MKNQFINASSVGAPQGGLSLCIFGVVGGVEKGEREMVLPHDLEAKVVFQFVDQHKSIRQIAKACSLHRCTVKRILTGRGFHMEQFRVASASLITPFVPFIRETIEKYPKISSARIWQLCRERGYSGGPDHFRSLIRLIRPRKAPEAFFILSTLIGEQAQVDWGDFGKITVGKATRRLYCFVMVLSWSRKIYLEFFLDCGMTSFIEGHNHAFLHFGGLPHVALYDNLKSAVIERERNAIVFNENFYDYARTLGFEIRPVAKGKGNQKGIVERMIRYIRTNFFMARNFIDIDDLNRQAREWMKEWSDARRKPDDPSLSVEQAHAIEQKHLRPLPGVMPSAELALVVSVQKTPYIIFDTNRYSVPPQLVKTSVTVRVSRDKVRVLVNNIVVADHIRSYGRREAITDPIHLEALWEQKAHAGESTSRSYLRSRIPILDDYLVFVAEEKGNIGSTVAALARLVDSYGGEAVGRAIQEALEAASTRVADISLILDRDRKALQHEIPLPISLPNDPRVHAVVVQQPDPKIYDTLGE
jgi:transposase